MRPRWRVGLLALLFTGSFAVLFIRLGLVQLAVGDKYLVTLADQNIVSVESIAAPRGDIVDRNGIPLATSRPQLILEVRSGPCYRSRSRMM